MKTILKPIICLSLLSFLFLLGCGDQKTTPPQGSTPAAPLPLTSAQEGFALRFAENTGLHLQVVKAWLLAEESSQEAQARQKANNNNWLNLGFFDGKNPAAQKAFQSPYTAADYTAEEMKRMPAGKKILASAKEDLQAQIQAISQSGWAINGYGQGKILQATLKIFQKRNSN